MKRFLLVSASTGTGHIRASEAVREALARAEPAAEVEHVDLLDLAPSWVRGAYGGGYELLATKAPRVWGHVYQQTDGQGPDRARWSPLARRLLFREFQRLLAAERWDACLSTHFLPCQLLTRDPNRPPLALAITDFTLHKFWVQPGVRDYFVATDKLAAELTTRVPGAVAHATGIPVSPAFETPSTRSVARTKLALNGTQQVVLVVGGGLGVGIHEMTKAALAGSPPEVQLIAVCGRNGEARCALEALDLPAKRLRVEGFVRNTQDYITAADLVVTKPGGLTISEALALSRPLVLTRPIPGQEVGNTRELVAAGAALSAADPLELQTVLANVLGDEQLLRGIGAAARRLSRPSAARDVVSVLMRLAGERATFSSALPHAG